MVALLLGIAGCGTTPLGPASLEDADDQDFANAFAQYFAVGDSPRYVVKKVAPATGLESIAASPGAFNVGIFDPGTGAAELVIKFQAGPVGSGAVVERKNILTGGFEMTERLTIVPSSSDSQARAEAILKAVFDKLAELEQ